MGEWHERPYEAEMRVAEFQNGYCVALCNLVGQEEEIDFRQNAESPGRRLCRRRAPPDSMDQGWISKED